MNVFHVDVDDFRRHALGQGWLCDDGWVAPCLRHNCGSTRARSHPSTRAVRYAGRRCVIVASLPEDNVAGYDKSTHRIKLKRQFIRDAENDDETSGLLMMALVEEFGHAVDDDLRSRFSAVGGDATLDEGAAFGYSIVNLGWDLKDQAEYAQHLREGETRLAEGELEALQRSHRSGARSRRAAQRRHGRCHRVLRSRARARQTRNVVRARVDRGRAQGRFSRSSRAKGERLGVWRAPDGQEALRSEEEPLRMRPHHRARVPVEPPLDTTSGPDLSRGDA